MSDRVTVSGRVTNVSAKRVPCVMNWLSRYQAAQFQRSGGARGAHLGGKPIFRLTIIGRTTGQPRTVMLMLVHRGEELLVCGSQGGTPDAPQWWKNLVAAGRAIAQVGNDTFDVDVRVITDAAERAHAWTLLTAAYPDFASYQALTDRVLPIAVLARRIA